MFLGHVHGSFILSYRVKFASEQVSRQHYIIMYNRSPCHNFVCSMPFDLWVAPSRHSSRRLSAQNIIDFKWCTMLKDMGQYSLKSQYTASKVVGTSGMKSLRWYAAAPQLHFRAWVQKLWPDRVAGTDMRSRGDDSVMLILQKPFQYGVG